MKTQRNNKFEIFLNRIHEEKPGDAQTIIGLEVFALALTLILYFLNSPTSFILKIENYNLFLVIVISLILMATIGLIVLIYGVIIKPKK